MKPEPSSVRAHTLPGDRQIIWGRVLILMTLGLSLGLCLTGCQGPQEQNPQGQTFQGQSHPGHVMRAQVSKTSDTAGLQKAQDSGQDADTSGLSDDDPWETYNRSIMLMNFQADRSLLWPLHAFFSHVPHEVRLGFSNVIALLETPASMVNSLLQGDPLLFLQYTGRLLLNAVVGWGGLIDVATPLGLGLPVNSFGKTLRLWGVPRGPFLVTPLLGPSTLRDAVGRFVDLFMVPVGYISRWRWVYMGATYANTKVMYRRLEDDILSAFEDPYAAVRDAVLNLGQDQSVENLVQEGDPQDPLWQMMHGSGTSVNDKPGAGRKAMK